MTSKNGWTPGIPEVLMVAISTIEQALSYARELGKIGRGTTFQVLIPGTSCGLLQDRQIVDFLRAALAKARGEDR